jgi:RNA recognition motif-containing protein
MNIYVGNLAWKARKQDLTELFEHFGDVTRAFIVRDKRTRRSKGFGFVEMTNEEQALVAIETLHNTVFMERAIVVNEANPRKEGDTEDLDESDDEDELTEVNSSDESADSPSEGADEKL